MKKLLAVALVLMPAVVMAQEATKPPPLPAFEDQLYMIARAQEQKIKELELQVRELQRQVDEGKKMGEKTQ